MRNGFLESKAFIIIAAIGLTDMAVQAVTSGEVKLIRMVLGAIFGEQS